MGRLTDHIARRSYSEATSVHVGFRASSAVWITGFRAKADLRSRADVEPAPRTPNVPHAWRQTASVARRFEPADRAATDAYGGAAHLSGSPGR
jgi:hypothetical protein